MSKKADADNFFSTTKLVAEEKEPIAVSEEEEDFLEEDFEEEDSLHDEAEEESEKDEEVSEEKEEFSKDDPKGKRFQYWQSQANKEKNARKQIETKLEELKAVAPIAEFLRKNPKALDGIEEYVKSGGFVTKEPTIEKPTRPAKPSNFSYLEAEENPDGESGKYLRGLEAYQDRLADYYAQKDEQREKKVSEIYQTRLQQEEEAEKMRNLSYKLQHEYELSVADANSFITEMNSPGSVEMDSLVDYWKFKRSNGKSKPDGSDEKAQALRERAKRKLENKSPVTGSGGGGNPDSEKMFLDDLRKTGRNLFEYRKK